MNKTKYLFSFIILCLIISSCSGGLKDYDGNIYKTVKIGTQEWMSENLNVSHFKNGDSIPQVKSAADWINYGNEGKPAWCFMENNPDKGRVYGRLYNWYAVNDSRGLAPEGWHVATDDEWTGTINYFGGGVLAALKMRTTGISESGNNNEDQMGFSGLPGGCRNNFGNFYGVESFGYWWSSTENNTSNAWLRVLNYVKCDINSPNFNKIYGASVRCVRN